jgi:hypothetical protein
MWIKFGAVILVLFAMACGSSSMAQMEESSDSSDAGGGGGAGGSPANPCPEDLGGFAVVEADGGECVVPDDGCASKCEQVEVTSPEATCYELGFRYGFYCPEECPKLCSEKFPPRIVAIETDGTPEWVCCGDYPLQ